MIAQYVGGAIIYAMRIPERFWPGRFDIFGASHQIWHVFVFTATFTLYFSIRALQTWRLDDSHSCDAFPLRV